MKTRKAFKVKSLKIAVGVLCLVATEGFATVKTAADYDVGDYVQTGLVANYDAIRNVGATVPHSADATTWVNLVTGNANASFAVDTTGKEGAWIDNAYRFAGGSHFVTGYLPLTGLEATFQIVSDIEIPNTEGELLVRGKGDFQCVRVYATQTKANWTPITYTGSNPASLEGWKGDYWNAATDADNMYATFGTDWSVNSRVAERTAQVEYDEPNYQIGGHKSYALTTGDIHAFRVYSRKLTNAELLQNRIVDEARFHGRQMVTNVVVAASVRGLQGAEPPGTYAVDGGWTFSAQTVTKVVDGREVVYTPVGYTLETFSDGSWSDPVYHAGTQYVFESEQNPVRLTWRWRSDAGLILIFR